MSTFEPDGARHQACSTRDLGYQVRTVSRGVDPTDPKRAEMPHEESAVEKLFRRKFLERAIAMGGSVAEQPGGKGSEISVRLPYDDRTWVLQPQVPLGPTKPDFVLQASGGGVDPMAIYTDGKRWHAHPEANRVRDDAEKRIAARAAGYRVVAVTWNDLVDIPLPGHWFERGWAETLAPTYGLPVAELARLTDDPLTSVMKWMSDPERERGIRARLAKAVPLLTSVAKVRAQSGTVEAPLAGLAASVLRGNVPVHGAKEWVTLHGRVALAGRLAAHGSTEVALVLDDRDAALLDEEFDRSWRLWLHLANLLGWAVGADEIAITTIVALGGGSGGFSDGDVFELAEEWVAASEYATPAERKMLTRFARTGLPLPELGREGPAGVVLSFSWAHPRIAVAWGLADGDFTAAAAEGWTLIEAERGDVVDAVLTLLRGAPHAGDHDGGH